MHFIHCVNKRQSVFVKLCCKPRQTTPIHDKHRAVHRELRGWTSLSWIKLLKVLIDRGIKITLSICSFQLFFIWPAVPSSVDTNLEESIHCKQKNVCRCKSYSDLWCGPNQQTSNQNCIGLSLLWVSLMASDGSECLILTCLGMKIWQVG